MRAQMCILDIVVWLKNFKSIEIILDWSTLSKTKMSKRNLKKPHLCNVLEISRIAKIRRTIIFLPYLRSFLALLIHGDRLLNKFHSYALYDTENNFLFSIDHMPAHPISLRVAIQDAIRCLTVPLQDRPLYNSYIFHKSSSLLVTQTEAQGR